MYGIEIKEKVEGFRKNLIQLNGYESDTKFYDMLPYILVLNISKMWIKRLNYADYRKVEWYEHDNKINSYGKLIKSFKQTIGYINYIIVVKPREY